MNESLNISLAAILLVATATASRAAETKVKLADLPAPVAKTVKQQSQGAKLKRVVKDVEGRVTTYEAELTVAGRAKDVTIDPDGTVTEVEEEVPLSTLPAAAKAAIEKAAEGGKLLRVEAISHNGPVEVYEAEIKKGSKKTETRVDPAGNPAPKP